MSEILISCDPSGKDISSSKVTVISFGRQFGKQKLIRDFTTRPNIVIIDDLDEPVKPELDLEAFRKNVKFWIETYFPRYAKTEYLKPDKQNIKLGVKKRYIKAPAIQIKRYANENNQIP